MKRSYNLCIVDNKGKKDLVYSTSTIEEMDKFTKCFVGYNDLINYFSNDINSGKSLELSNAEGKVELILFSNDKYNNDELIKFYFAYLFNNRNLIDSCLLSVLKDREINKYISDKDLWGAIKSYLKKDDYKKYRDVYLELTSFGAIDRNISDKVNDIRVVRSNYRDEDGIRYDDINSLIDEGNFDSIYRYYDLDDISNEDIERLNGGSNKKR